MTPSGTADITEIVELDANVVSGVASPANGADWLVLKATEDDTDECSTCKGKGTILAGNRKCPDCKGTGKVAKSDSSEADEEQELLTGEAAKEWENAFCGDDSCEVCIIKDEQGTRFHPAVKALSQAERKEMPSSAFAFIDKKGGRHLPIHDSGHIKSALGRHAQQDFSEARGDPADAKAKAARRILAAAKKHGINVNEKSAVAEAAKKCVGPNQPPGALDEPKAAGNTDLSKSGTRGSVATALAEQPPNPALRLAGAPSYATTLDGSVQTNPPIPVTTDGAGITDSHITPYIAKAAHEFAAMVHQRAIKDAKVLSLTPPQGDAAMTPGSAPWESYDAATLQQVGECLASCCTALDEIAQRERTEGATVTPGDNEHAWSLEEAEQALDYALGVVARLSFHEAAEGVAKAGRVLSEKDTQALKDAYSTLQAVIDGAQGKPAGQADPTEEQDIMATITKEELGEAIASGVTAGFEAREKARKERKDAKKQRQAEKAQNEQAEKAAVGQAAGDGELTEDQIKPTASAQANDPNAIPDGGSVASQYVNKEGEPTLADLQKQIAEQGELLTRIANRPRPGGPMLGGQAPQGAGGPEGAAKEQGTELAHLEKGLQDALATGHPQLIERAGEALTKARLQALNAQCGWPTGS